MTELIFPRDDPRQQLAWARRVLRYFPPRSGILGAKEIRAMAVDTTREAFGPQPDARSKMNR